MTSGNTRLPFTPKRPLSVGSNVNSLLASTHKRYKAAVSSESKVRSTNANKLKVDPNVANKSGMESPRPRSRIGERPKTPSTPKAEAEKDHGLERDVSRIDVEASLVDASMVDAGDISAEIDEAWLRNISGNAEVQADDKVMVSIRLRPTNSEPAWSTTSTSLKLDAALTRTANGAPSTTNNTPFTFNSVFTSQTNKAIYTTVALPHVHSAMSGYNAVVFAYGQTASGKTHTLSGSQEDPGIIPRSMKDVFAFIRRNDEREYLLRCSYLEIYNETIIDLLATPSMAAANPVQIQGTGDKVLLTPLREEVVGSFKAVKEVLKRGEGNRRTACTDWNERSSRSHSVFRLVIESRERGGSSNSTSGRHTPGLSGRMTPGGSRLQAKGDKSVQTSMLSLIDLAGSEKATSDKDRTREGKYINTSLLTLGTVIGTLSENAAKNKTDHVPYRNSKLTRILQPSLSGNARISVICTINPDPSAITESTSTLLFARRIKGVALNAKKKEIVDTDALIERYRKEIEDLKKRLAEREEADSPQSPRKRRLSAQEQIDESKAMKDLNARIQQLTKLILTSQTVTEETGSLSRPSSPVKVDFDMEPYQLQQELLAARYQLESQANQILSLESALVAQKPTSPDPSESSSDPFIASSSAEQQSSSSSLIGEKDALIAEQSKRIKELEADSAVSELKKKLEEEVQKREEKERWSKELERALDKEKKMRVQLEEERRALAAFVSMFDSLGLGGLTSSAASTPTASPVKPSGPPTTTDPTSSHRFPKTALSQSIAEEEDEGSSTPGARSIPLPPSPRMSSPARSLALVESDADAVGPSLLDEEWGYIDHGDISFEQESMNSRGGVSSRAGSEMGLGRDVVPIADKLAASIGLKGRRGRLGGAGSKENNPIS